MKHPAQLKQLVKKIRESMATASPEQKSRLAGLLEQHLREDRKIEELQDSLARLETLEVVLKKAVKQTYFLVDQVRAELGKTLSPAMDIDERDSRDLRQALEQAHEALQTAAVKVNAIEQAISDDIRAVGWDIHDKQDQALAESGDLDEAAYNKGYKDFQIGHNNPPRRNSPSHPHYMAGYRAAAKESGFRQ
jgi:hypothetical protein